MYFSQRGKKELVFFWFSYSADRKQFFGWPYNIMCIQVYGYYMLQYYRVELFYKTSVFETTQFLLFILTFHTLYTHKIPLNQHVRLTQIKATLRLFIAKGSCI